MRTARAIPAAALAAATTLAAGCVERRFVIESNVPNAQVYIDDRPIGAAPADDKFDYYGYYNVTLVHPNFAPVKKRVRVRPPWYAYPPFDLLAECVWPFHIEDVRTYHFEMTEPQQVPGGTLIESADKLRGQGWSLPAPQHPQPEKDAPPRGPGPAPLPTPTPVPGPAPAPLQTPTPLWPAGPPTGPSAGAPPLVPSVQPSEYTPPRSFLR